MVKPVIGTGIKLGKPRVEVNHSRPINKSAEQFDGTVRNGESVSEYQRRVLGRIISLNWDSKSDSGPEL
jgi:hypothetical protein